MADGFQRKNSKQFNVAYVGNLLIESLDRSMLIEIISNNIDSQFHLFGNVEHSYRINSGSNLLSDNDEIFVKQLKSYNNVTLYGTIQPENLVGHLNKIDLFLLLYKKSTGFAMDNSHKIIEYLSFAKPVVSTYLSHYKDNSLFLMCDAQTEITPTILFEDAINNYSNYSTEKDFKTRIDFSMEKTYEKRLATISRLITKKENSLR